MDIEDVVEKERLDNLEKYIERAKKGLDLWTGEELPEKEDEDES